MFPPLLCAIFLENKQTTGDSKERNQKLIKLHEASRHLRQ